jgi:hypothetical protein
MCYIVNVNRLGPQKSCGWDPAQPQSIFSKVLSCFRLSRIPSCRSTYFAKSFLQYIISIAIQVGACDNNGATRRMETRYRIARVWTWKHVGECQVSVDFESLSSSFEPQLAGPLQSWGNYKDPKKPLGQSLFLFVVLNNLILHFTESSGVSLSSDTHCRYCLLMDSGYCFQAEFVMVLKLWEVMFPSILLWVNNQVADTSGILSPESVAIIRIPWSPFAPVHSLRLTPSLVPWLGHPGEKTRWLYYPSTIASEFITFLKRSTS